MIYAQNDVQIFEVLGWKYQTYCEDLCLLATLFIESKIEIKNVHRFRFYVVTVRHDDQQYHFAGFFSKLQFQERLNLSCLLILPPYRNRGFGSLLIDLSESIERIAYVTTFARLRAKSTGQHTHRYTRTATVHARSSLLPEVLEIESIRLSAHQDASRSNRYQR